MIDIGTDPCRNLVKKKTEPENIQLETIILLAALATTTKKNSKES